MKSLPTARVNFGARSRSIAAIPAARWAAFVLIAVGAPPAMSSPIASIAISDASIDPGQQTSVVITMTIAPPSDPIIGVTLNFSGTTPGLEFVSFTRGPALAGWIDLDPFTPADGIVSMGSFGSGLIGTVELGRLTIRAANPGRYTVRLSGGHGAQTSILAGVEAASPTTSPGTVTVGNVDPFAGDLNCDGMVNASDAAPFALALVDADGYREGFPACDMTRADMNADDHLDGRDVATFVTCLLGDGCL